MSPFRGSYIVRTPSGVIVLVTRRARLSWLKARELSRRQRVLEWIRQSRRGFTVFAVSALIHAILLLLLALIILGSDRSSAIDRGIHAEFLDARLADLPPVEDQGVSLMVAEGGAQSDDAGNAFNQTAPARFDASELAAVSVDLRLAPALKSARETLPAFGAAAGSAPQKKGAGGESPSKEQADSGLERLKSQFDGRSAAARPGLVKAFGGNEASEAAVAAGLKWLAAHQRGDGSWSFNHLTPACDATCTHPGTPRLYDCEIGATGLALLAFLGAGQTPQEGDYQRQVAAGIEYLLKNQRSGPGGHGIDFRDGSLPNGPMYVQAIATMALSEAYAMTGDRRLREPAQGGVDFIAWSQDPLGGGWRYRPQAPGDTSVVGWQAMALTSARVARLDVPRPVIPKTLKFLRSVQSTGRRRLRLHEFQTAAVNHRDRPLVQNVSAAERHTRILPPRGADRERHRPLAGRHVLQLLRHAVHASIRRRSLEKVEREDARLADPHAGKTRPRRRQLGPARPPRPDGGPPLCDGDVRDDPRSLLPPSPALSAQR